MRQAHFPDSGMPQDKGTVYLTAADASGMMVSFIHRIIWALLRHCVPDTGISLQIAAVVFAWNRTSEWVAGGKRPYTYHYSRLCHQRRTAADEFRRVMGGHMQPQGHAQMMIRIFKDRTESASRE
jgi:gamma-glutamyltranspeptidase/glutathione hydrolase